MTSRHQLAQEMSKTPHITFICDEIIGFWGYESGIDLPRYLEPGLGDYDGKMTVINVINLRRIVDIIFH